MCIRDRDSSDEEFSSHPVSGITLRSLDEESLEEPDIRGLWEKAPTVKKKQFGLSGGEGNEKGKQGVKRNRSKAEIEMMKTAMDKLKKSAIIKQVAGGREFKVHKVSMYMSIG